MNKFVVYSGNYPETIRSALLKRGNWEEIPEDDKNAWTNAQLIWRPNNFTAEVFNHFENNRGICTKTGLIRTLRTYYLANEEAKAANYQVFDSIPTSYILIAGEQDSEYLSFVARFRDIAKQQFQKEAIPAKHCQDNIWLVKPANMNQGRGIEIFKNLKDINAFLNSRASYSYWVAQKYIERPLLYYQRKFDIRVWVLVTNNLEVYFFNQGYLRTSSDTYDLRNPNNYVHLTNNCLQKHGKNYGKWEDGNTIPFDYLKRMIKEKYPEHDFDFDKHVLTRMKDLVIDTFLSWKKNLNPSNRKFCFELFGYDFLLDEDLRTWLLEVNMNPYLGIPNDFIAELLPRMLDNMFEITLDPIFPPKEPLKSSENNGFELIYREQRCVSNEKGINKRSPFSSSIYPIKALEPSRWTSKSFKQKNLNSVSDKVPPNKATALENLIQRSSTLYINNMEMIYKNLQANLNFRNSVTLVDTDAVSIQLSKILELLEKPEVLQSSQLKYAYKAIEMVSKSAAQGIFGSHDFLSKISKLLNSTKGNQEIIQAILTSLINIGRDSVLGRRILCNKIIHGINEILLRSCQKPEDEEPQVYSKEILFLAMKCAETLCGMNPKQVLPTHEIGENERSKYFYMAQGGIMTFCALLKKSSEAKLREAAEKIVKSWMTEQDWKNQGQILEKYAGIAAVSEESKDYSPKALKKNEKDLIFFKFADLNIKKGKELETIICFQPTLLLIMPLKEMAMFVNSRLSIKTEPNTEKFFVTFFEKIVFLISFSKKSAEELNRSSKLKVANMPKVLSSKEEINSKKLIDKNDILKV